MIDIFVADDHALLRRGLRLMLDAEDDFTVMGEAGDVEAALRCTLEHAPAVTVLDPPVRRSNAARSRRAR